MRRGRSLQRVLTGLPPAVGDGALAGLFLVIAVVERGAGDNYTGGPLAVDVPMTALVVGLLALRRVAPMRVLVLTCAALVLPTFFVRHDFLVWSHLLPLLIDAYTVARHRSTGWAVAGGLLVAGTLQLDLWVDVPGADPSTVFSAVLVVAPVLGGVVLRRDAERRRAIAAALVRLDEQRAERQRLTVLEERGRVARDLHDVVAHAVSLMTIQARVAAVALESDPVAAERSVMAIEVAGRSATGELRRMLGLLRAGAEDGEPGGPAPDLDAIGDLVAAMSDAGLRLHLTVQGDRPQLPAGFEVNAYRIVQEALTNARTHAGPVEATVALRYGADVQIDVVNDLPPRSAPGSSAGYGLLGMRERVALLGGTLRSGPEGGRFAVRVRLPLPGPA